MKREDIEEKARLIVDDLIPTSEVVDELYGEEDAEPSQDRCYLCLHRNGRMDAAQMPTESTHTDNREVIARLQAENDSKQRMIEILRRNLAETIKQLKASHANAEAMLERVCEWFFLNKREVNMDDVNKCRKAIREE